MYVEFAAAAVDSEGKILACVTDAIQPSHEVDDFGEIVGVTYKGTKKELGYDIHMGKIQWIVNKVTGRKVFANKYVATVARYMKKHNGATEHELLTLPVNDNLSN